MKKRIISLLLALIMALSLLPVSVLAADDHTGQVHVTVENTTWAKADGAPWLFLVEAQKNRKTGLRVEPDILIRTGAALYGR